MLEAQLLKSKRLNRYGIEQLPLMPGWNGKINLVVQKEIFSTFKFLSKKTIQDVPQIAEQCFQAVMPNMSEWNRNNTSRKHSNHVCIEPYWSREQMSKKGNEKTRCWYVMSCGGMEDWSLILLLFLTYTSF